MLVVTNRLGPRSLPLCATVRLTEFCPPAQTHPDLFHRIAHTRVIITTGHEVIRGCMKDIEAALEQNDMETAHRLWKDLQLWDNLHMKMEEGDPNGGPRGVFGILDELDDNVAEQKGLRHHHQHLYEYEEDIRDAFAHSADVSEAVKVSFQAFQKENLEHLELEENIMMPSIMKLAKAGKPMKQYMVEDIFSLLPEEHLEFFIKFSNQMLEKHKEGMPRARVFNHALWAIATPEQWELWSSWIERALTPDEYKETQDAIAAWKTYNQSKSKPREKPKLQEQAPCVDAVPKEKTGMGIRKGLQKIFGRSGSGASTTGSSK